MLRDSLKGVTEEATYGGILSFMRRRYTRDLADADVAVLGIPFDLATTARQEADLPAWGTRGLGESAWERKAVGWGFSPLKHWRLLITATVILMRVTPPGCRMKFTSAPARFSLQILRFIHWGRPLRVVPTARTR